MLQLKFTPGDVRGALRDDVGRMAKAATATMGQVGPAALRAGRAAIASAGMSVRAQNALRLKLYPADGSSLDPAALVYDRIRYSEIFQTGGRINGNPKLWLPIAANLPPSPAAKWTPARYVASVGPLVSVNLPGRRPMLFAAQRGKGEPSRPLFIGVDAVTLAKSLRVDEAVAAEAAKIPDVYAAKLKAL
jgi:hypothetical protein